MIYEPILAITEFSGKHHFLSNSYPSKFWYGGYEYPCVESAYREISLMNKIDCDAIKDRLMINLLCLKFEDETLQNLLIQTHPYELINGNQPTDLYWGVYNGVGTNKLGNLLMEIRREYIFLIKKFKKTS